jgi:hypothetical protein
MKLKRGVTINRLQLEMRPVMQIAEEVWKEYKQDCVITSGDEKETNYFGKLIHLAHSYHYFGYALDFRIRYFNLETRIKVYQLLRKRLENISNKYEAILKKNYIHVEYNA